MIEAILFLRWSGIRALMVISFLVILLNSLASVTFYSLSKSFYRHLSGYFNMFGHCQRHETDEQVELYGLLLKVKDWACLQVVFCYSEGLLNLYRL